MQSSAVRQLTAALTLAFAAVIAQESIAARPEPMTDGAKFVTPSWTPLGSGTTG